MSKEEANAKEKIFQAAMELVAEGKNEQQITTREIASKAGVNLALVNYYYRSKENLLNRVVATMMSQIIEKSDPESRENEKSDANSQVKPDARERLRNMLITTANTAFKYHNICKIAISIELKSGCRNSCKMATPLLREIFTVCDETELNIIAMQLMIPFHHIVMNPEFYNTYLDTDFFDEDKRTQTIERMIDHALTERVGEEQ